MTELRTILSTLLLSMLALGAGAQIEDPVHFGVSMQKVSDTEFDVVFSATIDKGWHVYSTELPDGGPISATLTTEVAEGAKAVGKLTPVGNEISEFDKLFDMTLRYFENSVKFTQRYRITGKAFHVRGYLEYGACNDENCMPPTPVDFDYSGEGPAEAAERDGDVAGETVDEAVDTAAATATVPPDSLARDQASPAFGEDGLWRPVIGELQALDGDQGATGRSWLYIFLMGLAGGFIALFTPCVWPIIPMTVSFFLKRGKGVRDALTYGLSIVVIYVSLGLLVTLLFGASALNSLSTNAVFNILFFLMLVLFGASFLGGFDIQLPASWSNAVDKKAGATSGLLSIFLMAFTLALVSFSCTGPIIGFLLVEVGTSGSIVAPTVGMLGFAVSLAMPFTLFALFPSWLKRTPKSGGWMNCVKVSLGFLELAFSLKFLSVADLAYGWHILDREVFLSLWIIIFALWGAYLIGWLRFPHDEDEYDETGAVVVNRHTPVVRFFLAVPCFAFALYMVPGLWGAPCKAVSAFAPPLSTQDFNINGQDEVMVFNDYEEGMAYASAHHKPALLDFTGYGCVNCRKMEAAVWTDSRVREKMSEYVLISLYVDDKTPLPRPEMVEENGQKRTLRTVGDKWSRLQRIKFGANAQPFYVLVDNQGMPLNKSYSYNEDATAYAEWLETGLSNYK